MFCLSSRYLNEDLLSTDNRTKYEGANLAQPSLIIKSVSAEDMGEYSCVLENEAGKGESENVSTLEVLCKFVLLLLKNSFVIS